MIILSVDSGFEKTGYAVFKKSDSILSYITSGVIFTSKNLPLEQRIYFIYKELEAIILAHKPTHIVYEKLFFFKNSKTVIQVAQSQGVLLSIAGKHSIPVFSLTPLQIKEVITGYGSADKKSIKKMISLIIQANPTSQEDDETDAIACGIAFSLLRSFE